MNLGRFIGSYEFKGVTKVITTSGVKKLNLMSKFELDLMPNLYMISSKKAERATPPIWRDRPLRL